MFKAIMWDFSGSDIRGYVWYDTIIGVDHWVYKVGVNQKYGQTNSYLVGLGFSNFNVLCLLDVLFVSK